MELIRSIGMQNEYESALMWHSQEISKIESEYSNKDGQKTVNIEEIIEDYFEKNFDDKKEQSVSNALNQLYF